MSRSNTFTRSRFAVHGLAFAAMSILSPLAQAEVVVPGSLPGDAEFLLNTDTTTPGIYPGVSIAQAADGSYVLAYQVIEEGHEVYAQRFNADGTAKGDAFRVNTTTIYHQYEPSVAMAPDGAFSISWHSTDAYYTDPHGYHAYSQAYDADGNPVGGEVDIPNQALRWGEYPVAAMAPDHSYVVVWNGGMGVYAHRFDVDGNLVGGVIEVAPHIDWAEHAAVAMNVDGSFLVAWKDEGNDGDGNGVMVSKYAADGSLAFGPQRVNTTTAGNQEHPAIAAALDGSFIVAFDNVDPETEDKNVLARAYSADGTPVSEEFLVNQTETADQRVIELAATPGGHFVALWSDASRADAMMVRMFEADGSPVTSEAPLSLEHVNVSLDGSISANANGDVLAAWSGSERNVYMRVIAGDGVDLSLSMDASGDAIDEGDSTSFTLALTNVTSPSAVGIETIDALRGTAGSPLIEMPLQGSMSLVDATGDGWTCSDASGTVRCLYDTALKSGEGTSDLTVDVAFAGSGEIDVVFFGGDSVTGDIDATDNTATTKVTVNAVEEPETPGGGSGGGGSAGFALLAALGLVRLRRGNR